jgi:hypothetical protein
VSLACLVAAGVVGLVAIVDHHRKQARINDAQVADYFCRLQSIRCGGTPWRRIEDEWQTRQLAYEIAVIALGGFGLALIGYRVARGGATTSSSRSGR